MNLTDFQPSGRPYLKSGTLTNGQVLHVEFPYVTQEIALINRSSGDIKLFLADPATTDAEAEGAEFVLTDNRDAFSMRVAVKELWLKASDALLDAAFSLAAELSEQPAIKFTQLTGDGIGE